MHVIQTGGSWSLIRNLWDSDVRDAVRFSRPEYLGFKRQRSYRITGLDSYTGKLLAVCSVSSTVFCIHRDRESPIAQNCELRVPHWSGGSSSHFFIRIPICSAVVNVFL